MPQDRAPPDAVSRAGVAPPAGGAASGAGEVPGGMGRGVPAAGAAVDRVAAALARVFPGTDRRRLAGAAGSIVAAAAPEGRASKRHGGGATRAVPAVVIEPPRPTADGEPTQGPPHHRRPEPKGLPRGRSAGEAADLRWPTLRRAALVAYAEAPPGIAHDLGAPIGLWRALALEAARGGEWGLTDPPTTTALQGAAKRLVASERSRKTADPDTLWLAVVALRVLDDLSGRRVSIYSRGGPQPAATWGAVGEILAALGRRPTATSRWPSEWASARRLIDGTRTAPGSIS